MKLSPSSRFAPARGGFTLIELLVVITIIAVLVTGAFTAFYFVVDNAKRVESQSLANAVVTAIEQYHREYDQLPQPVSATRGTDCETDTSAAEGLLPILMGLDKTQNSRGTNFITDVKDASLSGDQRTDGLVRDGEKVGLVDSWGGYFKVRLDLDLDGVVANPNEEESATGRKELHKSVILYSAGKDHDFRTWKDNVNSWKMR